MESSRRLGEKELHKNQLADDFIQNTFNATQTPYFTSSIHEQSLKLQHRR